MGDRSIARRYATAFIALAAENRAVDKLGEDLTKALALMDANDGQLYTALSNPVFTSEERKAVLAKVVPMVKLKALTRNMLNLMLDNGRFALLRDVVEVYSEMADDKAGRARVLVETAEPLTPQLESEVRTMLESVTGKTVTIETKVSPELIGGIVARIGSRVYDASIRTRLENVKTALLNASTAADA